MTEISLFFKLPKNLKREQFFSKLSKKLDVQITSQQYMLKTFYDSFDWRLYRADMVCEFNHSQSTSQIRLIDRNTGALIAKEDMQDVPKFFSQFPEGVFKKNLQGPLEMRALLPLCQLQLTVYHVNVLNKEQKTVLRIQLDEYESLSNRVSLLPLKGYEKALHKVRNILQKSLALEPAHCSVLNAALNQIGRKPQDYSSKLSIKLKPDMPADKAARNIFQALLQAMRRNEAGVIADTDSEFLHDFRVAVRRTRAALKMMQGVLPGSVISRQSEFFSWLGQITGPTRDLDVYLLSYEQYKAALPIALRDDITPLYHLLKQKQVLAQQELAEKLNSTIYRKQLLVWEQFLQEPLSRKDKASSAGLTIKELANQRIWKVYKRILKEGRAIHDSSPAVALHDLRKTCKKLRYLMEFFQSLYPENEIKDLIKALKNFQTVLGDFQDYDIQEATIKQFSAEMMDNHVPSNTLLAMGVLVLYLDTMKCTARQNFAEQFAIFEQADNQAAFQRLFAHKIQRKK
jgi:CHAD domain-containing protein